MHDDTIKKFVELLRAQTGLAVSLGKADLIRAKVERQLTRKALTADAYLALLMRGQSDDMAEFVNDFLTSYTGLFRTPVHFDVLRLHLRQLASQGRREINLWSAACASGEEAWSMAIVAQEALAGSGATFRVLGTDLSTRALTTAAAGQYRREAIEVIPRSAQAFFGEVEGNPSLREVSGALRDNVSFARLDLAHPPFPMRGPFDVIFCRNVLMYLGSAEREAVAVEIRRLLAPRGLVVISTAEVLADVSGLKRTTTSVYQRDESAR
mgnify:FL=1